MTELLRDGAHVVADPRSVEETRAALAAAIDAAPVPEPTRRLDREALERCDPETWLASQLDGCPTVRSGDR